MRLGSRREPNTQCIRRRLPIGAECVTGGGADFRVWAPQAEAVAVLVERDSGDQRVVPLIGEGDGYFSGRDLHARAGDRYWYVLDQQDRRLPDPASRFQPEGPAGASMLVDPGAYEWRHPAWPGVRMEGQILYEMHVGTFTPEGTWRAASDRLPHLRDVGITLLEVMPVHDFHGRFGWGYDGVCLFAPTRLYGSPDDFRAFIDQAHGLGLGVVLDVVYNHVGPGGEYLRQFSPRYFSSNNHTDWGSAINFDGEGCGPVREFFIANAAYWIDEFRLDGLRLDATQNLYDSSQPHILTEVAEKARQAAGTRSIVLIAENEPQDTRLLRPRAEGGYGLDGMWNDDFHHSALVALTGHAEAYFSDYRGRPQEFVSAAKHGFLFQGQCYRWQGKRRGGSTAGIAAPRFIHYLENHDQVANLGWGLRLHELSHPGAYRAMTALLLLSPQTPLLFQGQEFGSAARFVFFADHEGALAQATHKGRLEFLSQFANLASAQTQAQLVDPADPESLAMCRLDFARPRLEILALHRGLIRLRREDPIFRAQAEHGIEGAVLGDHLFVLRFGGPDGGRLLIINLGVDADLTPVPEPLLAPPSGACWQLSWSSEDPSYGGSGATARETIGKWIVPGQAAFVFKPSP